MVLRTVCARALIIPMTRSNSGLLAMVLSYQSTNPRAISYQAPHGVGYPPWGQDHYPTDVPRPGVLGGV